MNLLTNLLGVFQDDEPRTQLEKIQSNAGKAPLKPTKRTAYVGVGFQTPWYNCTVKESDLEAFRNYQRLTSDTIRFMDWVKTNSEKVRMSYTNDGLKAAEKAAENARRKREKELEEERKAKQREREIKLKAKYKKS